MATRSAVRFAFVFAIGLAALCVLLVIGPLTSPRFVGVDFISYWCAWVAVGRGLNPYDAAALRSIATEHGFPGAFPFLYPPPLAVLAAPLGRLAPWVAWRAWTLASALAAGLAGALVVSAFQRGDQEPIARRGMRPALVVALLLVLNARNGMVLGQIDLLVLGAIAAALALRHSRPAISGSALAVAALLKMTPALLGLLLIVPRSGRRRFVLGGAIATAVLVGATLAIGGLGPWSAFVASAPHFAPGSTPPGLFAPGVSWNLGFAGWLSRIGLAPATVRALSAAGLLALAAPIAVTAVRASRRGPAAEAGILEGLALPALATMVVCAPFAYVHHMVFLLPGAVWILGRTIQRPPGLALFLALTLAAIDFPLYYPHPGWGDAPLLASLNFYALLGVWALSLALAARALAPARRAAGRLRVEAGREGRARSRRRA